MAKKAVKKAAKQKKPRKGVVGDASSPKTTTLLMPPKSTVQSLAKDAADSKKRTQSISGTLGKKVADAAANKHLDRKAFGIARGLADMDDERLHITYFHLLKYLDDLGVVERATAQGEMFESRGLGEGEEESEDDNEAEEAASDDKVVQLGQTRVAREVAEAAGN